MEFHWRDGLKIKDEQVFTFWLDGMILDHS